jgi:hypothetical protein
VYVRDSKNVIGYQEKPIWGPDHTSTLDTVNNLDILYAGQGKLDGAEKMYRRALPGRPRSHINIFHGQKPDGVNILEIWIRKFWMTDNNSLCIVSEHVGANLVLLLFVLFFTWVGQLSTTG